MCRMGRSQRKIEMVKKFVNHKRRRHHTKIAPNKSLLSLTELIRLNCLYSFSRLQDRCWVCPGQHCIYGNQNRHITGSQEISVGGRNGEEREDQRMRYLYPMELRKVGSKGDGPGKVWSGPQRAAGIKNLQDKLQEMDQTGFVQKFPRGPRVASRQPQTTA